MDLHVTTPSGALGYDAIARDVRDRTLAAHDAELHDWREQVAQAHSDYHGLTAEADHEMYRSAIVGGVAGLGVGALVGFGAASKFGGLSMAGSIGLGAALAATAGIMAGVVIAGDSDGSQRIYQAAQDFEELSERLDGETKYDIQERLKPTSEWRWDDSVNDVYQPLTLDGAVENIFSRFDTDGDGAIPITGTPQLQTQLSQLAPQFYEPGPLLATNVDASADGSIDRPELATALARSHADYYHDYHDRIAARDGESPEL